MKKGYCEYCGFKLDSDGKCPNSKCQMFRPEDYVHEVNQ